jgi:hypothetical protein
MWPIKPFSFVSIGSSAILGNLFFNLSGKQGADGHPSVARLREPQYPAFLCKISVDKQKQPPYTRCRAKERSHQAPGPTNLKLLEHVTTPAGGKLFAMKQL